MPQVDFRVRVKLVQVEIKNFRADIPGYRPCIDMLVSVHEELSIAFGERFEQSGKEACSRDEGRDQKMFLLGVDTVTADAQSIERRNAEGAGEVSIAAAPELSVSEGESDIPRDAPGNVIEFFRRLLHGE